MTLPKFTINDADMQGTKEFVQQHKCQYEVLKVSMPMSSCTLNTLSSIKRKEEYPTP